MGDAAPRSAVVERLRARIAVCRRHHRSCEGRYERGRAESSDRERQSTRTLLSLVQHGQAARKAARPARAAPPAPPAPPAPGDPRPTALLPLQGPLKRKQPPPPDPAHGSRPNGFLDGNFLDIKKICVGEVPGPGQGPFQANSGQSPMAPGALPLNQAPPRKPTAPLTAPPPTEGLSSLGLKPVKKEPGEAMSCSRQLDGAFGQRLGEEPAELDPELQELFNELSSISVPPLSDLELDNMISATIKQGDPFSLDLGQPPSQRSPPGPALAPDKPLVKSEYSPGRGPAASGSPQLRPPSASPAFSVAAPALPVSSPLSSVPQGQPQPVPGTGRVLPGWQEVSHAQQLKQIAANRQHHGHLPPPSQPTTWPGATAPAFSQEKTPSPSFTQQSFVPQSSSMPGGTGSSGQSKALGSYLLKANTPPSTRQEPPRGLVGSAHSGTKLLFHFGPEPGGQQPPPALASPGQPCLPQYPTSLPAQPAQPAQPPAGQPLLRSALPAQQKALMQKMQGPALTGLGYQLSPQHRQEQQTSAITPSSGPGPAGSFLSSQLMQQLVGKKQTAQRPLAEQKLLLPTQMLVDTEKLVAQDQMSRHLSRPPPDYKDQRRNTGNMSSGAPYPGPSPTVSSNSSQALANPVSTQALGTPSPSLLTPALGARLQPGSAAIQNQNQNQNMGAFASPPCSQPGQYSTEAGMGRLIPQRNLPQLGVGPGGPLAPRPPTLAPSTSGSSALFAATCSQVSLGTSPQPRLSLPHGTAGLAPQRATPEMLRPPATAPPSWASPGTPAKPQDAPKPASICFPAVTPAAYTPSRSLPQVSGGQQFPSTAAAPPNTLAPVVQARPLSQVSQTLNGPGLGPLRSLSLGPSPLGATALPALNPSAAALGQAPPQALSAGSFLAPGQSSRPCQGPEHGSPELAFDFLSPQTDGMGPALNSDADFIDSLLKTEPGNSDWMRDINLDEILGGPS
ncbi:mastermind-like protein 2 [Sorex araneus]|uniref:mastermind-like protein 2 n=1 Tax=Sorex araneus TaxID=42254 RepID=UPI002433CD86|nr:mastermind-like protein 2 [Sorex araneus]